MAALAPLPAAAPSCGPATVVLFGGERDSGPLDDCWLTQLPPSAGGAAQAWAQPDGGQHPLPGSGSGEGTVRWLQLRVRGGPAPRFGHVIVGESRVTGREGRLAHQSIAEGHQATGIAELLALNTLAASARAILFEW